MRVAEFLVSKDPATERTGDMAMLNLVLDLAREAVSTRYIALSERSGERDGNRLVVKPPRDLHRVVRKAVLNGRSLVHSRFDSPELRGLISRSDADIFVADHSYMAEPYIGSGRSGELYVNTVVSESLVWNALYGVVGRLQNSSIERDELRVARNAISVATYDADESAQYQKAGIRRSTWLDLTLPPRERRTRDLCAPRLAFLGDRGWPPNQEGFRRLLQWWPQIRAGIPGAELVIIGRSVGETALPDGVRDLGFVPDLEAALSTCRAMLAPIMTGGGVRVKILESISRGMPVVGTSAAIGSLGSIFDLEAYDEPRLFIEQARRFLLDESLAVSAGDELYARNVEHWRSGAPHRSVEHWLAA